MSIFLTFAQDASTAIGARKAIDFLRRVTENGYALLHAARKCVTGTFSTPATPIAGAPVFHILCILVEIAGWPLGPKRLY